MRRASTTSLPLTRWLAALLLVLMGLWSGAMAQTNDSRFSDTLSKEDKAASGIARLTSDQLAVLDALFRRDTAARGATPAAKTVAEAAPAAFSQRLSADERRNTGIATLTEAEVTKLDAFVERQQNALLVRIFLAPPGIASPRVAVRTERKEERRVHGSFSLSYGFGKGGYSEKTGSMVVTVDDPERNMSLSIGYSQSHIKGGTGYIYRDPFYDYPERSPIYRDPIYRDPIDHP
ncbi:MAG: hypothetical protein V4773_10900 [Verrucomicrobiota bacterium]